MNKGILLASSVALALSIAACSREERTTADFRGAPPNAAAEPQNSTASSVSSPMASGEPGASTESAIGGTSSSAGGSGAMSSSSAVDSSVGATSGSGGAGAGGSAADLMKAKGCMNCHDPNTKKVGPSFKDIAAKKPAKDAVVTKLKEGKGHPKVAASDAEINTMVEAVLATK